MPSEDKSAYDQLIDYVLNKAKERELDKRITKLKATTAPMEEYYKAGSKWEMDNPTYEERVRMGQLSHEAGRSKQDYFVDDKGEIWPMELGQSDRYGDRQLNYDEATAREQRIKSAQAASGDFSPEPEEMRREREFEQAKVRGEKTNTLYEGGRRYMDEWLKREAPGAYATGQPYYDASDAISVGVSHGQYSPEELKQLDEQQKRLRFLQLQEDLSKP